jgi:hypothetical protein
VATDYWRMTIERCPTCRREGMVHSFRFDETTQTWAFADAECTFGCPRGTPVHRPALADLSPPLRAPRP